MIRITPDLLIPDEEFIFSATRSGGPDGQHVNTTSTKVAVEFDVAASPSLAEVQKARILDKLSSRISADGVLRVVSADSRSQSANKDLALARLTQLLAEALHVPKRRRKTRPTLASRERRLGAKKVRSGVKGGRKSVGVDD